MTGTFTALGMGAHTHTHLRVEVIPCGGRGVESCAAVTKIWGGGGGVLCLSQKYQGRGEFCACHKNIRGGGGGGSSVPVTKISEGAGVLCLLELAPSRVHDPAEAYLILAPPNHSL